MSHIVGFGETVADFIPVGQTTAGHPIFETLPGGSVSNVCVAVSRLGERGSFIGQVGDEDFGRLLRDDLNKYGVDTSGVIMPGRAGTMMNFGFPRGDGEYNMVFQNMPTSETGIRFEDVDLDIIDSCDLLHMSTAYLGDDTTRGTSVGLAEHARSKGIPVSFDVNWRPPQYPDPEFTRSYINDFLKLADIIKTTDEEVHILTHKEEAEGVAGYLEQGASIVLVTRGSRGSSCYFGSERYDIPALKIDFVESTGCGDCYLGGFLVGLLSRGRLDEVTGADVHDAARFASVASGITATRRGAMAGMPSLEEVQARLHELP